MPVVSQAQNRWAHWAEKNASGSEQKAAAEFVAASHGMKRRNLPKRKKPKKKHRYKPFGSLAHED